jgi:ferric-dicitrate binding protein FerR (iron transport regulator)
MQTNENINSAEALITGYLKGELTDDETRQLINWIKLNSANKRYFDEYCEIWITTKASLKNPGYRFQEGFWKFKQKIKIDEEIQTGSTKVYRLGAIIKYAAIFIIAFSLSGVLFYFTGKNQASISQLSYSELTVPMGSRAQFKLSDGTAVTLNAGSRLKYDNNFGISDRVVELEGEAYFKIATDHNRPFMVKTSHLNVRATGTAFNVKAYSDDKTIETTLVEGSVSIEEVTDKRDTQIRILKPNQKLTFFKEDSTSVEEMVIEEGKSKNNIQSLPSQKIKEVSRIVTENVNVEPLISWKGNRWIFEKQSLSEIATELERRFDVQIVFESEELKTFRFTGIMLAEPIEQVLKVMSISAPINFKLKGRVVTLSENKSFEEINKRLYKRQ